MRIIIALATLLTTSLTVKAQGDVLVSGQSFDYSFSSSSLSPIGPVGGGLDSMELYKVSLGWIDGTFLSGSLVTLSLFEDSTNEAPFRTATFDGDTLGSASNVVMLGIEGLDSPAWQDSQGVILLTVKAGSIEINQLGAETVVDGYRYGGFALIPTGAVPEPRSSRLLVVAIVVALTIKRRRTPNTSLGQRRLPVEFMDGLDFTTIIGIAEPFARRRGSALDR